MTPVAWPDSERCPVSTGWSTPDGAGPLRRTAVRSALGLLPPLGACAASCLVPRRPRGTRLMMAELLHPSPHIRQIYTNPTDATCTQLEGDLNEIYELLDQVVADYGVLAKSPDWWLQVPSNNLRPIELIMRCEDALGIDDDPQYAAEFLARMVADKYS